MLLGCLPNILAGVADLSIEYITESLISIEASTFAARDTPTSRYFTKGPAGALGDFRSWPVATNFSLGPDVGFRGEAEVGQAAEPAASVENDPQQKSRSPLFDHLVGDGKQDRWYFEVERLSGLEVDDELEFDGLDHRKISRLGAFEDATDVDAALVKSVGDTAAIAHQAASRRVFADRVNRGHHMAGGQRYDLTTPRLYKRIAGDGKCTGPLFDERGEGSLKVVLGAGFYDKQLSPESLRRNLCVSCFDLGVGIRRVHQYSDC
jgi:hypothetical protein